jgi:hypothetical protein
MTMQLNLNMKTLLNESYESTEQKPNCNTSRLQKQGPVPNRLEREASINLFLDA